MRSFFVAAPADADVELSSAFLQAQGNGAMANMPKLQIKSRRSTR
jgi:hypothetical protein